MKQNKTKTKPQTHKQEQKANDRADLILGDLPTSENKLFPFSLMVLSFYPNPLGAYFLVQQLLANAPESGVQCPCLLPGTSGCLEWLLHARCLTTAPPTPHCLPLQPSSSLAVLTILLSLCFYNCVFDTTHTAPFAWDALACFSLPPNPYPSFTLRAGAADSSKPSWVPPPGRFHALLRAPGVP